LQQEAEITVNGTQLTKSESAVVRVALAALDEVLSEGLGFRDDGIALTDRYMVDVSHVRGLIEDKTPCTRQLDKQIQDRAATNISTTTIKVSHAGLGRL
jgi:hypothetical protein